MRDQIASFARRRLRVPVGPDALVLDVGSGDKPHWRADVLVDLYPDASSPAQRPGAPRARVDRPLFVADASSLPFATGAFDHVICSHVLEHVADPARVIAELTRVARSGYLEVPQAASAKILDFPSHLWWCRLVDGVLVLRAKQAGDVDPEVAEYIAASGIERSLARLLDSRFDRRVISLPWQGAIPHRVEGRLDPALAAAASDAPRHTGAWTSSAHLLTSGLAMARRARRRVLRRSVRFDDVVAPEHRRGNGEVLRRGIYRL